MNKRDLIDAIAGRMGDKKTATEAVNAVLETIQAAVAQGDKVSITGFGVFEKAVRPERTARNPATGASVKVPSLVGAQVPGRLGLQGHRERRDGAWSASSQRRAAPQAPPAPAAAGSRAAAPASAARGA